MKKLLVILAITLTACSSDSDDGGGGSAGGTTGGSGGGAGGTGAAGSGGGTGGTSAAGSGGSEQDASVPTVLGFEDSSMECATCMETITTTPGPCAAEYSACEVNQECVNAMGCVITCQGITDCVSKCSIDYPNGFELLNKYLTCACCETSSPCWSDCESTCTMYRTAAGPVGAC